MLTIEPDACFGDNTHHVDRAPWVFLRTELDEAVLVRLALSDAFDFA
jgi:hypothetical protein